MRTLVARTFAALGLAVAASAQSPKPNVELFGAGTLSMPDSGESFGSLSPNGREFFYTLHPRDWSRHRIVMSRLVGTSWSKPELLPFSGTYNDREPKLSPDGRRLWFSSNRPVPGDTAPRRDLDLWFVDRNSDGSWGAPRHVEAPVNTSAQEFCPVVVANGTLYFVSTRPGAIGSMQRPINIWRARPIDAASGRYGAPENLGPAINLGYETNVFVTPDERVMFASRDGAPGGLGGDDLFVSVKRGDAWTPMRHLDAPINSPQYEYGPSVSADGRWLFFTSMRRGGTADAYRVDLATTLTFNGARPSTSQGALQAGQGDVDDRAGVTRAVLDYIEGFYEGDTAKLQRSLRPELSKYGFWRAKDSTTYAGERMTYAEAIAYAAKVRARNQPAPATSPKNVEIFEVQNQTASAKVTAWWGTDYLLLGKYDGRWMIAHVMWQGPLP